MLMCAQDIKKGPKNIGPGYILILFVSFKNNRSVGSTKSE